MRRREKQRERRERGKTVCFSCFTNAASGVSYKKTNQKRDRKTEREERERVREKRKKKKETNHFRGFVAGAFLLILHQELGVKKTKRKRKREPVFLEVLLRFFGESKKSLEKQRRE